MRVHLIAQFHLASARKGVHIKSKKNKTRKKYFKQKEYNVSGDNSRVAKWNWYNAMDGMLSEIAKANGVPGTNASKEFLDKYLIHSGLGSKKMLRG
jgi:hypothetical protein